MILQRVLLRLSRAGVLQRPMRTLLGSRTWQVERGEAAGLKLTLPQNLDFVRGSTEPPVQKCVAEHLVPGGVFYDVGANVGFFSLLAARCVGKAGSVYAFEPVTLNAEAIRRNAELNGFGNIFVFEVAADAKTGTGELFVTEWDGGASLSRSAVSPMERVQRRAVSVVALDDLIDAQSLRPPTLVKIDVEGAEIGAIHGMLKTIAKFRPVLVFEVDDGDKAVFAQRREMLDRFVAELGYRITHLEDSYPNVTWHVGHSLARPLLPVGPKVESAC